MSQYNNAFAADNVYGHALELLVKHLTLAPDDESPAGIHLDLGCGHGAIAEEICRGTGLTYVGVDGDAKSLADLARRGFETHLVQFGGEKDTLEALIPLIAGRRVVSISMLDTLEHLVDGTGILRTIRTIAQNESSIVVLSVPNITHRDIGFKLALGLWDYTETGILDTTHTRFFSSASFRSELAAGGLHPFDENDVLLELSDQHFPQSHSALAAGSTLNHLLRQLRIQARPDASTNQFVWACAPGPISSRPNYVEERNPARPLLSVVVRTQGRRLHCLREALTSLAGQTCDDFEVLVMGHRLGISQQIAVERVIEDTAISLRERIRLIPVQHGNRVAPLNAGFAAARGHYIAILDDDDIPLAHWVDTFRDLAEREPGRMLRTVSVLQEIDEVVVGGLPGVRTVGDIQNIYPAEFDIFDHLRANFTPNTAIAFPRGVFHDLGMRFDDELTTTEDWDFIMRAAVVVGVVSSPEITCIYHWWVQGESSRTVHHQREWDRNNGRIVRKLDSHALILPEGSASRIREILAERDEARRLLAGQLELPRTLEARDLRHLAEVMRILDSVSWRVTAPLRIPSAILRQSGRVHRDKFVSMTDEELVHAAKQLRLSRSWKLTSVLRRRS